MCPENRDRLKVALALFNRKVGNYWLQDPSDEVFEWSIPAHGPGESNGGKPVLE